MINSKPILELYILVIHEKMSTPDHPRLQTKVKTSIDRKLRLRSFDARSDKIETGVVVLRIAGGNVVLNEDQENAIIGEQKGQCSKGDSCSFWHDENKRAKPTPKSAPLNHQNQEVEVRRERASEAGLRLGSPIDSHAKNFLKSTCTKFPCDYWHHSECQFYKSESGCKFCDKCSFAHRQVEDQSSKKRENDGDKGAVAILKDARQLGCVFQDIQPPESSSIFRKSPKVLGPIRRVQFSKAALRHTNIRKSKGPSLGVLLPLSGGAASIPWYCFIPLPSFGWRHSSPFQNEVKGPPSAPPPLPSVVVRLRPLPFGGGSSPSPLLPPAVAGLLLCGWVWLGGSVVRCWVWCCGEYRCVRSFRFCRSLLMFFRFLFQKK